MCGIVGVVLKGSSGFSKKTEDTFLQMLYADQLRGDDSTGVIAVERDSTFHIAKEACDANFFIPQFKHSKVNNLMWHQGKAYIGHNRKKTVGAVSDETAHPFVVDKTFAMVHNGTLYNHEKLAKTTVDSEALAIHLHAAFKEGMAKGNTKEQLEQALGDVFGAYAVALYDQTRHRVYVTRNKERPLSIMETDDAWYFMSESLMGAWILARNGYDYGKLKIHHLAEHELVEFNLDTNKMTSEVLSPKKYTSTHSNKGNPGWTIGTTTAATTNSGKVRTPCDDKSFKRFRKDYLGKRITVYVDDLVEADYPAGSLAKGTADKVLIFAQSKDFDFMHTINAEISLSQLGLKYEEDIVGKKWSVTLDSAERTKDGVLVIEGSLAKPIAPVLLSDVKKNKEWRDSLCKLSYDELNAMEEETRYSGEKWQVGAVKAEKAFRDSITSVEEAAKKAKIRGIILEQVLKDGKFVYQDNDGNIYYESSIVVH